MYQVTIVQRDGQKFEILGQDGSTIFTFQTDTLIEAMEELVARKRGRDNYDRIMSQPLIGGDRSCCG